MGSHGHGPVKLSGKQIEIEKGSIWSRLHIVGAVMALVGIVGGFALYSGSDPNRWWNALLVGYAVSMALAVGGLFFTILQHLVRAGWSIVVRRTAEHMALAVPVVGAVGLLIALGGVHDIYEWSHEEVPYETSIESECSPEALAAAREHQDKHGHHAGEHATRSEKAHDGPLYKSSWVKGNPVSCYKMQPIEQDVMLSKKRSYLNTNAFTLRTFIFYAILSFLALTFWTWSTRQDKLDPKKDAEQIKALSVRARFWSAPALAAFGLSVTFHAFDFLMSLDPHWFSTIFGVYFFAGSTLSMFAFLAVVLTLLKKAGYLENVVTAEHFHDIGKFMFGFTVFWTYIGFSQYFLIWYADIPEETHWFAYRGHGEWLTLSLVLVAGRFVIPWFGLLRRGWKRNMNYLWIVGLWVCAFLVVDMYWLVMPARAHHLAVEHMVHLDFETAHWYATHVYVHPADFLAVLGVFGVFLATFGYSLSSQKLVPINDPRLAESLHHENF